MDHLDEIVARLGGARVCLIPQQFHHTGGKGGWLYRLSSDMGRKENALIETAIVAQRSTALFSYTGYGKTHSRTLNEIVPTR